MEFKIVPSLKIIAASAPCACQLDNFRISKKDHASTYSYHLILNATWILDTYIPVINEKKLILSLLMFNGDWNSIEVLKMPCHKIEKNIWTLLHPRIGNSSVKQCYQNLYSTILKIVSFFFSQKIWQRNTGRPLLISIHLQLIYSSRGDLKNDFLPFGAGFFSRRLFICDRAPQ